MKKCLCYILSTIMVFGMTMTAHAADTKIDKVSLKFAYDSEPKSGESIGSIDVTTNSNEYNIDNAEYINDSDVWSVGDRPLVRLEISAADGYRFSSSSKNKFSLSGCSATYKSARIFDSGASMELEVYLKRIGGKLSEVDNLEWSGSVATWDSLEGSKSYEVRLYRDEKLVTTVKTSETSYEFSGYINKEGDYSFSVRAIAAYNDRAGEWSDNSDDYFVSQEEAYRTGAGSGSGKWMQNQNLWWYSYSSGGYPSSCWKHIDNVWYYFNKDGYMATGWQKVDGNWFYLNTNGSMMTGWQNINGKWYCMAPNGIMYANTRTPDGYNVDASGAMY